MVFTLERVKKITEEIQKYIYEEEIKIDKYDMKKGNYLNKEEAYKAEQNWEDFNENDEWGGKGCHSWFKTEVKVPEKFNGKTIALTFSTQKEGWDAINPQFMLYVNDRFTQGLDVNHREVIISNSAKSGEVYSIDLHAYSGLTDGKCKLIGRLVSINNDVRRLYYNIQVPVWIAEKLEKDDINRIRMLKVLNNTINMIDLRQPLSNEFNQSVKKANEYIEKDLYEDLKSKESIVATCVGHTHIDVAWHWTKAQTREKSARSFSTVLKLMEEYPEYIFMSSQPQLYEYVKEDHPEIYERIKEKVKEGRWEPEGAMWVEADCNLTSGESLVRQLILGKKFFKEEFGVDNKILWLPDVFGYSAALPQILKKSEVDYFMTTKISWNEFNKLPYDTFMWEGIDGTEILTHCITTSDPYQDKNSFFTTYNGQLHPGAIMGAWNRYQQKDLNEDVLVACGFGDGGGGTTKEMLETGRRLSKGLPGCPKVQMGTSLDYFTRLNNIVGSNKELPKWVGELYLEFHRGTYTSMARNKKFNRKSEILYGDIENLSILASEIDNYKYPKDELDDSWKLILTNQFHDILPGSCIKEVYDKTDEEYAHVFKVGKEMLNKSLNSISKNIDLDKKSIVVYNTLSFNRDDLVKVELNEDIENISLEDVNGNEILCQIINEDNVKKLIFMAKDIPAKGYKVFKLKEKEEIKDNDELIINKTELENKFFKIRLDENANFVSIYDKLQQREVIKEGQRGNVLQVFEDKPTTFDNWNIDAFFEEKMWEINDVEKIEVIEEGPLKGTIRVYRKFLQSEIMQDISIYKDIPRIDFNTIVDWKQSQLLLKTAFPVDVHTSKATYDIQFGNIERPTHKNTSWDAARFEVCAHKWCDLSEDSYGVSLLNDCKYGHDIKGNVMRLTLIKSGIEPNETTDQEVHEFSYSLYPHKGSWKDAKTVQKAYEFNTPTYTIVEDSHEGKLPKELSMVKFDAENVILETIKKAEYGESIILRFHECYNRRTKVNIEMFKAISNLKECNLIEKDLNDIDFKDNKFSFEIKPYEIKTFKINLK